jgi:hypothetical protein
MNTTIKWQIVVEKYHVTLHGFNEHSIARNLSTGLDGTAAVTSHFASFATILDDKQRYHYTYPELWNSPYLHSSHSEKKLSDYPIISLDISHQIT